MPVWEPKLTSGGDDRVVGGDDRVVGGDDCVVGGDDRVVREEGVVEGVDVVVVMIMVQSGAARLSNSIKQVGSMW